MIAMAWIYFAWAVVVSLVLSGIYVLIETNQTK